MTIVRINVHRVFAERNVESKGGDININNNVSIKNIEPLSFVIEGKKGLKFTFAFNCSYEPDYGKIEVEGQILFVEKEEKISQIRSGWDKEKKIPLDVMEQVVNAALHKGNIQAIKISEEVGLPSPLPLPKVNAKPAAPDSGPQPSKPVKK